MIDVILLLGLLLGAGAPPQASDRYANPPVDQLTLSLTSDRSSYYVREPIELTLTLKNILGRPVHGSFLINPLAPTAVLRYRREGSEFVVFPCHGHRGGHAPNPVTLEPEEELSGTATIAFDPERQAFVLDRPGRYEFLVVYHDAPHSTLESGVLSIDVQAPPEREEQALASYSSDLAALAQSHPRWPYASDGVIKRAAEFIDRFPSSPYARHVRSGLRETLSDRVVRNRADKTERELYEKLKLDHQPPHP